ncbi:MAG: hypothetical protein ABI867_26645 [Kofleriaceae bacterium]
MHWILVVVVLACGCVTPRGPGRVGGGVAVAVGGLLIAHGLGSSCGTSDDLEGAVGDLFKCYEKKVVEPRVGGVLVAVGALILLVNELRDVDYVKAPKAEASPEVRVEIEPVPQPDVADPTLQQLTLQASLAARAGRCSAVWVIASRVEKLDSVYRYAGFEHDEGIAACLR